MGLLGSEGATEIGVTGGITSKELIYDLAKNKQESILPNLSVSLWILLAAPATVTSARRRFSKFKLTKSYLRLSQVISGAQRIRIA